MSRRTQFRLLVAFTLAWVAWAVWSLIDDPEPFTLRVLDDVGQPVAKAVVASEGRQLGLTGPDGLLEIDPDGRLVEITAPGHIAATVTLTAPDDGVFDFVLKARVLRGQVVDPDGKGVPRTRVTAGSAEAWTDEQGNFSVRAAEVGEVVVHRPAWEPVTWEWDGAPGEQTITMEPLVVRAVHITGEAVEERFDAFLEMAESSDLNALMVDLKDESGMVLFESDVPLVAEVGANSGMYDLGEVVAAADERDLYVVGRLVAFQDPVVARALPDLAVWDEATDAPFTSRGQYFLDPTDADARAYALDLAVEACEMGVDEIQFDYVRFPDARPESVRFDGGVSLDIRAEAIRTFLGEALDVLHPRGCAVAVDVFGFVTTALDDGGIGQRWEDITAMADVVSPMIYPSHYDSGWYGLDAPNESPDVVVRRALADGLERLSEQVIVRPWLQDFGYTTEDVRAQVDVAEKLGLGWMLWNATSDVTTAALGAG